MARRIYIVEVAVDWDDTVQDVSPFLGRTDLDGHTELEQFGVWLGEAISERFLSGEVFPPDGTPGIDVNGIHALGTREG